MTVEPLYNVDLETLLTIVRIAPADDANTLAAVGQAVSDVRLGLFSRLTRTRALEIAGYSLVDNPTTDEEILRKQGASAEALWLMILLVQRLPVLFMDNNAVNDVFNDEPLTRDANSKMYELIGSWKKQLELILGDLVAPDALGDSSVKSALNGPAKPYILADNLVGGRCRPSYGEFVRGDFP